jgi:hypothetical protein
LLVVIAVTGGIDPREVTSQSATTTEPANQTGGAGTQNQTQMVLENLIRADFEPVTGLLNSARELTFGNSTQDACVSLSDADDALFTTAIDEGLSATITIVTITEPIRNHIDGAQKALLEGDLPKALDGSN